jgi:hypothetical protein
MHHATIEIELGHGPVGNSLIIGGLGLLLDS